MGAYTERLQVDFIPDFESLPGEFEIESDVVLRRITVDDEDSLVRIINANPDIPENVLWAARVEAGEVDVISALQRFSTDDMVGRYVLQHNDTVRGYIGAHIDSYRSPHRFEMGYFTDGPIRGHGYTRRGAQSLLEAVNQHLAPVAVYLQIPLGNEPSTAIANRLGFQPGEIVFDPELGLDERIFEWKPA